MIYISVLERILELGSFYASTNLNPEFGPDF